MACRLSVGGRTGKSRWGGPLRGEPTQREMSRELGMSVSSVHESLQYLVAMRLLVRSPARRGAFAIVPAKLVELLVNVIPVVYVPQKRGVVRGLPTSVFAPVLKDRFAEGRLPVVWPYAPGSATGEGLLPIYPSVPAACAKNERLYHLLSAVDVLRVGLQREREVAVKYIGEVVGRAAAVCEPEDKENTA